MASITLPPAGKLAFLACGRCLAQLLTFLTMLSGHRSYTQDVKSAPPWVGTNLDASRGQEAEHHAPAHCATVQDKIDDKEVENEYKRPITILALDPEVKEVRVIKVNKKYFLRKEETK